MIPKINMKETGNNIKQLMKANNVKPVDVQLWCGFGTVQPIYHWQHGKNLPTVDNLLILSYMLNCRMEDILVYDDEP